MITAFYDTASFWLAYSYLIYCVGGVVLGLSLWTVHYFVNDLTQGNKNVQGLWDRYDKLWCTNTRKGLVAFCVALSLVVGLITLIVGISAEFGKVQGTISFNELLLDISSILKYAASFGVPIIAYIALRNFLRGLYVKYDKLVTKIKKL